MSPPSAEVVEKKGPKDELSTDHGLLVEIHQQLLLQDYRLSRADERMEKMQGKVDKLEELRLMGIGTVWSVKVVWAVIGGFVIAAVAYLMKRID